MSILPDLISRLYHRHKLTSIQLLPLSLLSQTRLLSQDATSSAKPLTWQQTPSAQVVWQATLAVLCLVASSDNADVVGLRESLDVAYALAIALFSRPLEYREINPINPSIHLHIHTGLDPLSIHSPLSLLCSSPFAVPSLSALGLQKLSVSSSQRLPFFGCDCAANRACSGALDVTSGALVLVPLHVANLSSIAFSIASSLAYPIDRFVASYILTI